MTHDTGGNASAIGDGELDHGLELLVLGLALADMMAAVDVMTRRRRRRKRPNVAVINIRKQGRVC